MKISLSKEKKNYFHKDLPSDREIHVLNQKLIKNKLYDLGQTLKLNMSIIYDFIDTLKSNPLLKEKLKKKISSIRQMILAKEGLKKEIEKAKSENLLNTQILDEIKSRKDSTVSIYKEKYEDLKSLYDKKAISIKMLQKKFNEVQIYVRRECQNTRFKELFIDYEIYPFILNNENMLRYKKALNEKIKEASKLYNILDKENSDMKNKNENKNLNINNININNNKIKTTEKFDNMIKLYNEKINFSTNFRKKLYEIIHKIMYDISKGIRVGNNNGLNILDLPNMSINDIPDMNNKTILEKTILNNDKTILLNNVDISINCSYIDNKGPGWDVSQIIKIGD